MGIAVEARAGKEESNLEFPTSRAASGPSQTSTNMTGAETDDTAARKAELNDQLKEYIAEWRKTRESEEQELQKLKEKQAKRKEIRAEQEKKLNQQKKEEEEKLRKEENEKKAKEAR